MTTQRGVIKFAVDGQTISALTAGPQSCLGRPLIAALRVPVHNALGEFDALWDSTPATVEQFAKLLTAAPFVDASIARSTGHSIDHHILGYALHLRQLAFVGECALWGQQSAAT